MSDVRAFGSDLLVGPSPGQVFADLLLLSALSCQVPVALLSVRQSDGKWSSLWHGVNIKDNRANDQLFETIAGVEEPAEFADLFTRVPRSQLVRAPYSMRWSYGVALRNRFGALLGITAIVDKLPRRVGDREHQAMMSLGRQLSAQLIQCRGSSSVDGPASEAVRLAQSACGNFRRLPLPNSVLYRRFLAEHPDLLQTKQVAALFGVTERSVVGWAAAGKIRSYRTAGGRLRFRHEDILYELSPKIGFARRAVETRG